MTAHRQLSPSPSNDTGGTKAILPPGFPVTDGSQPCATVEDADRVFFPSLGEEQAAAAQAEKLCRNCTFQQACGAWAIQHERHGIWAATTPRERNRLRRERVA